MWLYIETARETVIAGIVDDDFIDQYIKGETQIEYRRRTNGDIEVWFRGVVLMPLHPWRQDPLF